MSPEEQAWERLLKLMNHKFGCPSPTRRCTCQHIADLALVKAERDALKILVEMLAGALEQARYEIQSSRAEWMADPALVELEGRGLGPSKPLEIIAEALSAYREGPK